ncbi:MULTISPECIES: DNA polymerase I [Lentihominibacter]|uniref:DNA polymerase I n=1 Tax=Lentihominibacter hominis TaxID=2763645 RepID=A0A926EB49_9FIRM|nr:DNA polymerase I [Lentihominibacter hominis]MBC8568896.1 DNA polymerase I [Lentihominibacter hominis]
MKKIAIIDGNSLINRAYYAMRNPMITKDGIFTQGIFGFLNMLDKIKRDYEPEYMAVAFDMKAPTFRHKEYEEYKAGRKKMPPELAMQIPLLKDILRAMNIKQLELEGFEADDIIGTIAKKAETEGLNPYIITGDKDELQLASDVTKVIITRKGVSEFDIYDREAMIEKYGFTPEQFIDFKGLMGDQSDNIPGVPGVGEKTATKLVMEFGSIENLLSNTDNIKPKGVKQKIEDNAQMAVMSKRLATINTQVPIEVNFEEFFIEEPDYDKLVELYTKLEFNKFLKKLNIGISNKTFSEENDSHNMPVDTSAFQRIIIDSDESLNKITFSDKTVIKVFGDYNHTGDVFIEGVAAVNGGIYYYFDYQKLENFPDWLLRQDVTYWGHGLKRDYFMLMCEGVKNFDTGFDTMIAQYVLDSGRSNYSLAAISNEYLHITVKDEKNFFSDNGQVDMFSDNKKAYVDYGFDVCTAVLNLADMQKERLKQEELDNVFYNVEIPLIIVMASMEYEGFKVDKNVLRQFGHVMAEKIDEISAKVFQLAGETFNLNSPFQLGDILFEKLGLPAGKKTKRGYSTSADILEKIKDKHPIVPAVLEYRTLSKLKSTYIEGLIPLISETDGKVHAHFNQTVTTTGRISCTEPNLQNIPIRQEMGRKLRKAFIPDSDDCVLVGADYSQIELRVLAHMSADQALIEAFNRGEDIHRATAANVLGVPEEEITIEERSRAKAVNFGVIYGMSSFGLSTELNITRKDAEEYINTYFKKHMAVKAFMDGQVEFCREKGYVTTIMGRKRYIKEIKASAYMVRQVGERLAMNTPIQGSAADIIKIAMIKVYNAIKERNLKSSLILQVHDELIINTYKDEKEEIEKLLVENMEGAYQMAVKLKADLNEGSSWYELK